MTYQMSLVLNNPHDDPHRNHAYPWPSAIVRHLEYAYILMVDKQVDKEVDREVDMEVDREVNSKVDKETHSVKGIQDMGSWYNLELPQCYRQALEIPTHWRLTYRRWNPWPKSIFLSHSPIQSSLCSWKPITCHCG